MKKKIFLVTLLTMLAYGYGDVYIKYKNHTDTVEIKGQVQPARDDITERWIGENKVAVINPGNSIVLDLNKNIVYIIYHSSKTFVEAPLPLQPGKLLPEQSAAVIKDLKISLSVTPTGETKKIGNWNCKGYDMTLNFGLGKIQSKIWTTTEVPFDYKLYRQKMLPYLNQLTHGLITDETAFKEYLKIDGFQVASYGQTSIVETEIKTTQEVVEILTDKVPPTGIYTPPSGYAKIDKLRTRQGI